MQFGLYPTILMPCSLQKHRSCKPHARWIVGSGRILPLQEEIFRKGTSQRHHIHPKNYTLAQLERPVRSGGLSRSQFQSSSANVGETYSLVKMEARKKNLLEFVHWERS